MTDRDALNRALGILFRLSLEQTGWRRWFRRWTYSDEPLRNDAANLVRQIKYREIQPVNSRLLGEKSRHD